MPGRQKYKAFRLYKIRQGWWARCLVRAARAAHNFLHKEKDFCNHGLSCAFTGQSKQQQQINTNKTYKYE